jgi:serine/threonine-protein kinase RsbT
MPEGCESLPITSDVDVVRARQAVRSVARGLGFGLVDQTKLVTAASELARNALDHGGGGLMRIEVADDSGRRGLRLTFEDHGPGIPDPELALTNGFSTGKGLGLGLGGARRLVDDFRLVSAPGKGTTVVIARWQRHGGPGR